MSHKKKQFKFENYKNSLEATQLDNKIKYLEKNKINIDSFKKKIHDEFIINNKSILKTHPNLEVKGTMFLLKKLIRLR